MRGVQVHHSNDIHGVCGYGCGFVMLLKTDPLQSVNLFRWSRLYPKAMPHISHPTDCKAEASARQTGAHSQPVCY